MKKLRDLIAVVLVFLAIFAPMFIWSVVSYHGGSSEHFSLMQFVGPMTCQWTDGSHAIMTNGKSMRFYNLDGQSATVGVTYEVKRGPSMKFIQGRPYLTPVKETEEVAILPWPPIVAQHLNRG